VRDEVASCRGGGVPARSWPACAGVGGVRRAACFDPSPQRSRRGHRRDRTGRAEGLVAPRPPPALALGPRSVPCPVHPRHRLRGSRRSVYGSGCLTAARSNAAGQGRGVLFRVRFITTEPRRAGTARERRTRSETSFFLTVGVGRGQDAPATEGCSAQPKGVRS